MGKVDSREVDVSLQARFRFKDPLKAVNAYHQGNKPTTETNAETSAISLPSFDATLESKAQSIFAKMDPTDPTADDLDLAQRLSKNGSPGATEFLLRVEKHKKNMGGIMTADKLRKDLTNVMSLNYGKSKK